LLAQQTHPPFKLVDQVRANLNAVLQGLTLAELVPLINGGNPLDLIPNPNQAICDQIAALNIPNLDVSVDCRPGWAILVDQIVHQAKDIAIAAELSDYDLFENLASGIDHDAPFMYNGTWVNPLR